MKHNEQGDKEFDSAQEAADKLREWTLLVVRWLHGCREQHGDSLPFFPQYRTVLNDISNVTRRWIVSREDEISNLKRELEQIKSIEGDVIIR